VLNISLLRKVSWHPPTVSSFLLIKWWMILRVILVSTTIAVVSFFSAQGNAPFQSGLLPPIIAVITIGLSYLFYRAVKKGGPSEIHYFLQYFFDISLISFLNLITLPLDVNFIPLYVLSIAVASILSFRSGAFFTATLASIFYLPVGLRVLTLGVSLNRVFVLDILYINDRWLWLNVGLQVFLFYAIALITSYISIKLQSAGSELEDTRKLLRQHRLDTNEILQNISSGMITCNAQGVIVYANASAIGILGLSMDKLLGERARRLFSRLCPEIERIISLALKNRITVNRLTVEFTEKQGKLPLAVSSSLLLEQSGRLRGVSLIFEDITHELKARELELRSGKLEAVAELAASLAHEIKNPLASIRSAVELIRDSLDPESKASEEKLFKCILKESDRLAELLKQFLQFASSSFGPAETLTLGPILEQVVESVKHHPDWRREVKVEISPQVCSMQVKAQEASISQVFFNLMINAVQAGGANGKKASRIVIEPRRPLLERRVGNREATEFHWLCFYDNGPGIEPSLRERIFEPFFTTRKGGFGLGLAVVNRMVNALGGVIFVDEPPQGTGAAFIIALPRHTEEELGNRAAGKQVKERGSEKEKTVQKGST